MTRQVWLVVIVSCCRRDEHNRPHFKEPCHTPSLGPSDIGIACVGQTGGWRAGGTRIDIPFPTPNRRRRRENHSGCGYHRHHALHEHHACPCPSDIPRVRPGRWGHGSEPRDRVRREQCPDPRAFRRHHGEACPLYWTVMVTPSRGICREGGVFLC